jgi:acyl carrier protein
MTDVNDVVMRFLSRRQQELGQGGPVGPDTLVFDTGLLDSLALLDLVAEVEKGQGQAVDMLRFDPSAVDTASDLAAELSAALRA